VLQIQAYTLGEKEKVGDQGRPEGGSEGWHLGSKIEPSQDSDAKPDQNQKTLMEFNLNQSPSNQKKIEDSK